MQFEFYYKDTCISDYLTDHHNKDNECLIMIPLGLEVEDALAESIDQLENDLRVPENLLFNNNLLDKMRNEIKEVDLRIINDRGDRINKPNINTTKKEENEYEQCLDRCFAATWFVLKWEE